MKRVCSWCKKEMGETEGVDNQVITHGICPACLFHVTAQGGIKFSDYINALGVPIAVVGKNVHIQMANVQLKKILGKNDAQIIDSLGGEVFECEYSYLPEKCGNTEHCAACLVRNAVEKTFKTGKSQNKIIAYLNQRTPQGMKKLKLVISTEKVNDVVMLRIDEIAEADQQ